jgi:uncharacterized protein with HEPN domain
MSKRDPKLLLEDILDAIRKIHQFTQGLDFNGFIEDEKTHDAVIRNFEVIGEAVNQLPHQLLSKHPDVQWHKIVGVRNRVIHEYFGRRSLRMILQAFNSRSSKYS